jgi:hypothetical protein
LSVSTFNFERKMKKIFQLTLAVLSLLPALTARAWTYSDGDVLLIFRESGIPSTYPSPNNDVEFDIGSVTNFLGKTNGYTVPVTAGWSLSAVTSVFTTDLTGVSVVLVAATSPTNATPTAYFSAALPQTYWFNGVEPFNTAYNVSPAVWQGYWTKINSIGTRPGIYGASGNSFGPNIIYSYDRIVSSDTYLKVGTNGTINADWLPQFGGTAPFTVEGVAPGSFGFLAVSSVTNAPAPRDTYIGTFTITAAGALTFTAGPPQPVITGITRSGNANTVSFSTTLSGSYSLIYTNKLGGISTNWPSVGSSLVGDGNTDSLTHNSSDSAGFYKVVRTP